MWYVACTRARDLLIIPDVPAAASKSWARVLDLPLHELPQLPLDALTEASPAIPPTIVNDQTPAKLAKKVSLAESSLQLLTYSLSVGLHLSSVQKTCACGNYQGNKSMRARAS